MIEKDKAVAHRQKLQDETDKLRSELYGGKNDSLKLISELRDLQDNLFNKEDLCQKLQTNLEELKSKNAEISIELLEANKTIKEIEKPIKLCKTSDIGI